MLLQYGSDVRQETSRRKIPLYAAADNSHFEVAKLLLGYSKVEDLFHLTQFGTTPMSAASKHSNKEIKHMFMRFCVNNTNLKVVIFHPSIHSSFPFLIICLSHLKCDFVCVHLGLEFSCHLHGTIGEIEDTKVS